MIDKMNKVKRSRLHSYGDVCARTKISLQKTIKKIINLHLLFHLSFSFFLFLLFPDLFAFFLLFAFYSFILFNPLSRISFWLVRQSKMGIITIIIMSPQSTSFFLSIFFFSSLSPTLLYLLSSTLHCYLHFVHLFFLPLFSLVLTPHFVFITSFITSFPTFYLCLTNLSMLLLSSPLLSSSRLPLSSFLFSTPRQSPPLLSSPLLLSLEGKKGWRRQRKGKKGGRVERRVEEWRERRAQVKLIDKIDEKERIQ